MQADLARKLDRFLFLCSIVLFVLLSVPPVFGGSIGLWLMQCVPLALILPGIRNHNRRSLQWLCFLLLFCFTVGVLTLFSPLTPVRLLGALTTLSCIALFTAAIVRMRIKPRE